MMRVVFVGAVLLLTGCSSIGQFQQSTPSSTPSPGLGTPAAPTAGAVPTEHSDATPVSDGGCDTSAIQWDGEPVPTGAVFGAPLPKVIMKAGTPVSKAEALAQVSGMLEPRYIPTDLVLQLVMLPPAGSSGDYVQLLYSAKSIGATETDFDFFSERALFITQGPTHGRTAALVKETVGDSAIILNVGDYESALVHGNPLPNGVRLYDLYWSDGVRDFHAGATTTASELVNVARSIYCGPR